MSETLVRPKSAQTVSVVRGQYHRFRLIPIMDHHARFIPAGPVTFGVEGRVLGTPDGVIGERGASLHVFNADRSEEWLRFDCFHRVPHYHYVLHDRGHNVVWGYDTDSNGPMREWVMRTVRERLPALLRAAGAVHLADEVDRSGVDPAAVSAAEQAMIEADARTEPGQPWIPEMIREGVAWMARWKREHPQFNTVDEN